LPSKSASERRPSPRRQRQLDVAAGRGRALPLLDLRVQTVVVTALDHAVDQQPHEGGRQDADDDGDPCALHAPRVVPADIL
jgi:hypothetical protein